MADTRVEIADTNHKDNYNKVVIHKRKCVPYSATHQTVIKMGSASGDGCKMQLQMHNNNTARTARFVELGKDEGGNGML